MQILVAPFVSSGNWHGCLIVIYVLALSAILHVRPQVSNARSSAASYDPFSLVLLARLLVRTKILVVFERYNFLELRQETASIQILWKCEIVKLLHHPLVSAGFLSSASIYAIWKAVCRVMVRNEIWSGRLYQVGIINFILIGVVSTRSPFALDVGLLHDFILVRNDKLLISCVSSGNNDLSATRITPNFGLYTALLASYTNRLFPPWIIILIVLLVADLCLVRHGMCYGIDIIVLELVLIWNFNVAILVDEREHAVV